MPIRLKSEDQEFRNPLMFPGDAKTIDLDRVLLNLFILIQHNGVLPRSRTGRKEVTPETFVSRLVSREPEGAVKGFAANEDQVRWWVMSSLVDLVHRGKPEKEAVASLKALHLNSYKYRNPKHARDYGVSQMVYMMLSEASDDLLGQLRQMLGAGWDSMTDQMEENKAIDLDILGILRIVEGTKDDPSGDMQSRFPRCLCPGQARIFCDDVRRLLIYQADIPRHVLLRYLKVLIGLHTGLYLLKLFRFLPRYVEQGRRDDVCKNCPVRANLEKPFAACPYHNEFVVDCGDDPGSASARLGEEDASFYYARIHDYIRATFALNMALQVEGLRDKRDIGDIDRALAAIKARGVEFDLRFKMRAEDVLNEMDEEQRSSLENIQKLGLPPFETFIEMITQLRSSFHNQYHRELLDSLLQRNREAGLVWSGRSRTHGRRFWLSSRLIETLVQLAVLKVNDSGQKRLFRAEPILVEELLTWFNARYGMIINGVEHSRFNSTDVTVHRAFRENVNNLKRRLREIGFFNVLSDAYIMQRIRPRFDIEQEVAATEAQK